MSHHFTNLPKNNSFSNSKRNISDFEKDKHLSHLISENKQLNQNSNSLQIASLEISRNKYFPSANDDSVKHLKPNLHHNSFSQQQLSSTTLHQSHFPHDLQNKPLPLISHHIHSPSFNFHNSHNMNTQEPSLSQEEYALKMFKNTSKVNQRIMEYNFVTKNSKKIQEKIKKLSQDNLLFLAGSTLRERENYLSTNEDLFSRSIQTMKFNKIFQQSTAQTDKIQDMDLSPLKNNLINEGRNPQAGRYMTLQYNSKDNAQLLLNSEDQQINGSSMQETVGTLNIQSNSLKGTLIEKMSRSLQNKILHYQSSLKMAAELSKNSEEQSRIQQNRKYVLGKKKQIRQFIQVMNSLKRSRDNENQKLKIAFAQTYAQTKDQFQNKTENKLNIKYPEKEQLQQQISKSVKTLLSPSIQNIQKVDNQAKSLSSFKVQKQFKSLTTKIENLGDTNIFSNEHPKSIEQIKLNSDSQQIINQLNKDNDKQVEKGNKFKSTIGKISTIENVLFQMKSQNDPKNLHALYKQHRQMAKDNMKNNNIDDNKIVNNNQNEQLENQTQKVEQFSSLTHIKQKFQKVKPIFNTISLLQKSHIIQENNSYQDDHQVDHQDSQQEETLQIYGEHNTNTNQNKKQEKKQQKKSQSDMQISTQKSEASKSYRKVLAHPESSKHWDKYIFKSFHMTCKKDCKTSCYHQPKPQIHRQSNKSKDLNHLFINKNSDMFSTIIQNDKSPSSTSFPPEFKLLGSKASYPSLIDKINVKVNSEKKQSQQNKEVKLLESGNKFQILNSYNSIFPDQQSSSKSLINDYATLQNTTNEEIMVQEIQQSEEMMKKWRIDRSLKNSFKQIKIEKQKSSQDSIYQIPQKGSLPNSTRFINNLPKPFHLVNYPPPNQTKYNSYLNTLSNKQKEQSINQHKKLLQTFQITNPAKNQLHTSSDYFNSYVQFYESQDENFQQQQKIMSVHMMNPSCLQSQDSLEEKQIDQINQMKEKDLQQLEKRLHLRKKSLLEQQIKKDIVKRENINHQRRRSHVTFNTQNDIVNKRSMVKAFDDQQDQDQLRLATQNPNQEPSKDQQPIKNYNNLQKERNIVSQKLGYKSLSNSKKKPQRTLKINSKHTTQSLNDQDQSQTQILKPRIPPHFHNQIKHSSSNLQSQTESQNQNQSEYNTSQKRKTKLTLNNIEIDLPTLKFANSSILSAQGNFISLGQSESYSPQQFKQNSNPQKLKSQKDKDLNFRYLKLKEPHYFAVGERKLVINSSCRFMSSPKDD